MLMSVALYYTSIWIRMKMFSAHQSQGRHFYLTNNNVAIYHMHKKNALTLKKINKKNSGIKKFNFVKASTKSTIDCSFLCVWTQESISSWFTPIITTLILLAINVDTVEYFKIFDLIAVGNVLSVENVRNVSLYVIKFFLILILQK
jgi:hypothetical protein